VLWFVWTPQGKSALSARSSVSWAWWVVATYQYTKTKDEADKPDARAKKAAEALKLARVSAPTVSKNIKRRAVMATLSNALRPTNAKQKLDLLNETVLVTGPMRSGKSTAVREALADRDRAALATLKHVQGESAVAEPWCSELVKSLGVAQPDSGKESACQCVHTALQALKKESTLQALKKESTHDELPMLVVEADHKVTPKQLTDLLREFKVWGADEQLVQCVVVLSSSRAALSTETALLDVRV
jgi:hypothetical protein